MAKSKRSSVLFPKSMLIEVAWEVCNQVGGIYTVIRSKATLMTEKSTDSFCMIGPYVGKSIQAELDILHDAQDIFGLASTNLSKRGYDVHYAEWLIPGKPRVVLLNPNVIEKKALNVVKYLLWKNHGIETQAEHPLIDQVIAFGFLTKLYLDEVAKLSSDTVPIIVHFHEWMAGLPIMDMKREKMRMQTVFTTHATQLGRHLAINSPLFYAHLPFFDRVVEAQKFGIVTEESIEFHCAQSCDVFSTVSEVTAKECKFLLHRKPDVILPNGINIERFESGHEFQNLHAIYKKEIEEFVMGHFFPSYSFDLNKTLYLFTSGRYEFRNKGFDLILEALWQLNDRLISENIDITIVMFFITKREFLHIDPEVLHARALLHEIRQTCKTIEQSLGTSLFYSSTVAVDSQLPNLNDLVDDYWKLRYRRTIQSWKTNKLPSIVTHKLVNEKDDDILLFLNRRNFQNRPENKVKIVYHPDFITSTNPLFGMDYGQFLRGCHLGVFPSYYEPWGYTPLECLASGVPSVTSDLSGFGEYLTRNFPDYENKGMFVVERGKRTFSWSARQLAGSLYLFIMQNRRDRIVQRNTVENYSTVFDWSNLIGHYKEAYDLALQRRETPSI